MSKKSKKLLDQLIEWCNYDYEKIERVFRDQDFEEHEEWPYEEPKVVKHWGGEGCGEDYGLVLHFPESDVYVRIDGYYASYVGSSFDDPPYIVTPKEKTIIVYE